MSTAEERAMALVRQVSELPDRTSPADQPDLLLVTGEELAALAEGVIADDRHEQAEASMLIRLTLKEARY
jgi:hypothetical protein